MKRLNLLTLCFFTLCGCGEAMNEQNVSTDNAAPEQHEVGKPVIDGAPATNDDLSTTDPVGQSPVTDGSTTSPSTPIAPIEPATGSDLDTDESTSLDQTEKGPFDQNENQADVDLTAKIRSEITDLEDMSVAGRNVQIVSQNGKVTLSGDVPNEAERGRIEEIATTAAGEGNVINQLTIEE